MCNASARRMFFHSGRLFAAALPESYICVFMGVVYCGSLIVAFGVAVASDPTSHPTIAMARTHESCRLD